MKTIVAATYTVAKCAYGNDSAAMPSLVLWSPVLFPLPVLFVLVPLPVLPLMKGPEVNTLMYEMSKYAL